MKSEWFVSGLFTDGTVALTRMNVEVRVPAMVLPQGLRPGEMVELTVWRKSDARA